MNNKPQMWYIYRMEYYSATKRNEVLVAVQEELASWKHAKLKKPNTATHFMTSFYMKCRSKIYNDQKY